MQPSELPPGGMSMLERTRLRLDEMIDALDRIVSVESPTADAAACAACADEIAAVGTAVLGRAPEWLETEGRPALRWASGEARVLLLAHLDTVWPLGTLARRPFRVDGDVATGPGSFDMKAGLVQGLFALAALEDPDGVELLVTSDEETGSLASRALIEERARASAAALILEGSAGRALKIARKGVSMYRVLIHGRASHAGLEPERGINALIEQAHQILALEGIARPEIGTTVTPTVAQAGTARNVVPAEAEFAIDVRCTSTAEQERVDAALRAHVPVLAGATIAVEGGPNRPPLEDSSSRELFARARSLAGRLGLGTLDGIAVGGGSDGNFTAAVGTPTLDGLGAVGGGAHADDEHVVLSAMPERAALVAALIEDLRTDPIMERAGAGEATL